MQLFYDLQIIIIVSLRSAAGLKSLTGHIWPLGHSLPMTVTAVLCMESRWSGRLATEASAVSRSLRASALSLPTLSCSGRDVTRPSQLTQLHQIEPLRRGSPRRRLCLQPLKSITHAHKASRERPNKPGVSLCTQLNL